MNVWLEGAVDEDAVLGVLTVAGGAVEATPPPGTVLDDAHAPHAMIQLVIGHPVLDGLDHRLGQVGAVLERLDPKLSVEVDRKWDVDVGGLLLSGGIGLRVGLGLCLITGHVTILHRCRQRSSRLLRGEKTVTKRLTDRGLSDKIGL